MRIMFISLFLFFWFVHIISKIKMYIKPINNTIHPISLLIWIYYKHFQHNLEQFMFPTTEWRQTGCSSAYGSGELPQNLSRQLLPYCNGDRQYRVIGVAENKRSIFSRHSSFCIYSTADCDLGTGQMDPERGQRKYISKSEVLLCL